MKKVLGGVLAPIDCSANCNLGFVTIANCSSTCTATTDVGVKCGTKTQCYSGSNCNP